LVTQRFDSFDQ
ncbi:hypothetical protein D047_3021B, partial [Vibrio parahaemolyticus VPTS-2010_2]